MKISVIIPTYNEKEHIVECLDSLVSQTHPDYEVIVVDDGSTDDTVSLVEKYQIKLITQDHLGPGAARNKGVESASGEILVFVDADMVVSQNFLTQVSQPIVDGNSKGTFTSHEMVLNYQNLWASAWNWEYTKIKSNKRVPSDHPQTAKAFRAILKSEFESVGGYEQVGYGEDWTLSEKLGYLATATKALVMHKNPASMTQVFSQSSWIATRPFKLGEVGRLVALVRASFPVSILYSISGAYKYKNIFYPVFKIVYDAGLFYGIIKYWITGSYAQ